MGLRQLAFKTAEVKTSGGEFAVRGLSFDHVLGLFYRHRGELSVVFDQMFAESVDEGVTLSTIQGVTGAMLKALPEVALEIVVLGSGGDPRDERIEGDENDNPARLTNWQRDMLAARQLSIGEQADALEKIANLTFSADMPPGKLLALLLKTVQAGSGAATSLPKIG